MIYRAYIVSGYYGISRSIKPHLKMSNINEPAKRLDPEKFREIINTLSHDIREDLRIILGFIALLDDRYNNDLTKDADFRKFIFYIVEYGQKLQETNEKLIKMCEELENDVG